MLPRTKELPEAGLGLVLERSLVSKETHPALGFSETRRTGIGNASIARRKAHSLHWVMDIVFRDDECRVRTQNAPANFVTLKHMANSWGGR